MSQLVIHESSDTVSSSSDDELNRINRQASNQNYRKLIKSSDKIDKRLLDQYLIKQAHSMRIPLLDFKDRAKVNY